MRLDVIREKARRGIDHPVGAKARQVDLRVPPCLAAERALVQPRRIMTGE